MLAADTSYLGRRCLLMGRQDPAGSGKSFREEDKIMRSKYVFAAVRKIPHHNLLKSRTPC